MITQPGRVRFFKNIEIGSQAIDGVVAHRLHVSLAEAAGVRQAMCNPTLMQANMTKRIGERTLDDESLRRDVEHAMRAPLDDLAREIALCLRYFSVTFRTRRPDHARVFGNLADDPLLHKTLAHEAGLTTEVADPFELSGVDASNVADRIDDSPLLWSVALGTAMRGMYVPAVGRRAA